ncbi:tRNA uridine-5-carboxymethylaminomethyl(34) synthesis GTPase MnmE [Sabulicella glaciei]|uniref:tRNA modification GTPase MnmE n=1 Tax=Sabulicella glaciei TaxID=2984948 RepID=A0ABT3P149_9PROT|nr:tRNA uridine-5-carboxymethylaminomethyl(34) synthesis GTPase MnmE [Roseococcus sp. MDT2-1-1]MCW8088139.1 tRNA uridine-5-carboxymethylaminomethyl(34) synthesis GTPase MnmE [Roseococcus sp. MDT2-1-1]
MSPDTVFALASGAGRAAVAVLRISGPRSAALLEALAGRLPAPRMTTLRRLRHRGEALDRALVLWFPGPGSFTGEDSVELHLHGGPAVVAAVSEALADLGARPAEPGEFTRRAFLHGKLDLTAAEGIADLVSAETEAQRRQALRQAEGGLATREAAWTGQLLRLLARQEAFIEFEDEDLPHDLDIRVTTEAAALRRELEASLAESAREERLREGLSIAILGAPNAGKSSLLNALAGHEAAIVSARAGTTRDVVEVRLVLGGVPVTLADTAGLREASDEIEAEGVHRALARAERAALRLLVFAADTAPDAATLSLRDEDALLVGSKSDLGPPVLAGALPVSTTTGEGLPLLRAALEREAARLAGMNEAAGLTRPRHRAAIGEAVSWLAHLETAPLPELRAEALRAALRALSRLTGRVDVEAVLDQVFGEFCIGK